MINDKAKSDLSAAYGFFKEDFIFWLERAQINGADISDIEDDIKKIKMKLLKLIRNE